MKKVIFFLFTSISCVLELSAQTMTRFEAENWSTMSGMQTETTADIGGGLNVAFIDLGDWMDYNINLPTAGMYKFAFRIASSNNGNVVLIKNSSGTLLSQMNLPPTWGAQTWATVYTYISFSQAGAQTIRIESGSSSSTFFWNFNWFEISSTSVTKIEGEDYVASNGVLNNEPAWGDKEFGGVGYAVRNIDQPGDWMDYSVNLPISGIYTINLRVGTPNSDNVVLIKNSAGSQIGSLNLTPTGEWQTWSFRSTTLSSLPAGAQTIRIYHQAGSGYNLNFFELVAPTNQLPTSNAGLNQTIVLPKNTVTLDGIGSDPDGTIASYLWTKISGPVQGSITAPSSATTTLTNLVEGTYSYQLKVTDNMGGTATSELVITVKPALTTWMLSGNEGTNSVTHFIGTIDNQDLVFKTNNRAWARLKTDGTFETKKLRVTQSGWADYVFDSSYFLRPLSELQLFIKKFKHLPEVPSTKEVLKDGISVGDNQVLLLKKIEELTLYVITLNEELLKQREEIKKQATQINKLSKQ